MRHAVSGGVGFGSMLDRERTGLRTTQVVGLAERDVLASLA
jgi:hypothetical protein